MNDFTLPTIDNIEIKNTERNIIRKDFKEIKDKDDHHDMYDILTTKYEKDKIKLELRLDNISARLSNL